MKPRLQTSLGQQLVMTPQLRQAIKLLQMSSVELDAEITEAVETNPLLEWTDQNDDGGAPATGPERETPAKAEDAPGGDSDEPRTLDEPQWSTGAASSEDDNPAERVVEPESLADHLLWQLHLEPLSARDRMIGAALIDALDADGYLREPLAAIADTLQPELTASEDEILAVLCRIQQLEPTGIGARSLGECLSLQLHALAADADGRTLALEIVRGPLLERLPRAGIAGLAAELRKPQADVEVAVHLLRSLDPAPGRGIGDMEADTYVVPDCVVWRSHGVWQVALSGHSRPRIAIHRGYERMIRQCGEQDAAYLRNHLQEARWLLKGLEARGETLVKVMRCLMREQAGFLEFGPQALRPLTLREVAGMVGLHESTISRAIARKFVRTPRGTLPMRAFFASGIDTEGGGEASSTAIQSMIKRLIDDENPRKPLSDAKLADLLKATGVPVARRTVAKYREAMNIAASHERVRIG